MKFAALFSLPCISFLVFWMVPHPVWAISYFPYLSVARHSFAAAGVPGYVIFAGGTTTPDWTDSVDTVDIYNTVTGKSYISTLSAPRRQLAGASYGSKVYFAGGVSESGPSDVVDIFDVVTQQWSVTHLSQARYLLQVTVVANKIIFVGGLINDATLSDVVDIYDPTNNKWDVTHLFRPRADFGLAGSSKYGLILGGFTYINSTTYLTTYLERFDPVTTYLERFDPVTNLVEAFDINNPSLLVAIGASQTYSNEELMLFAGGYDYAASPLMELYYPNGTFYGNHTMISPRLYPMVLCHHTALCYIAGGASDVVTDKIDVATGSMGAAVTSVQRYYAAVASDNNDTIVMGGGYNAAGVLDSIEVARIQRIPYTPHNLTIDQSDPFSPTIHWDANILFTDTFTVERCSDKDPQWRAITSFSKTDVSYYSDQGLNYNTTYRYRVTATSDTAISATSNEVVELTTPQIAPPPTPTDIKAIVSADNNIVISWTLGAVNPTESNSTYIVIERATDPTHFDEIGRTLAPISAFTDSQDLQVNVKYYYRAYASATFRSGYSEIVSATLTQVPPLSDNIVDPRPNVVQIVPGVITPITIVAVGVIVLLVLLRRGKLRKVGFFAKMEYLLFSNKTLSLNIDLANTTIAERLRIPYSELTMIKQIGMGSYGEVFLGVWKQSHVAIKFCKRSLDIEEFLREAEVMLAIRPHPNIVQVLGVSTDGPQIALVLEFCQGGSLDSLLFDKEDELSAAQKIKLAAGIAAGIYHLHQSNIVHRDLAARNVLLTGDNQPKIADFGMSRLLQTDADVGATKSDTGPIRWMAPESLRDKTYSTKSDIWSFGIILYELVARSEPHISEDPLQVGAKIRDQGYTPTIPADCPRILQDIMESCWRFEPANRPALSEICNKLNAAAATL